MNKTEITKNRDGTYNVTLPGGQKNPQLPAMDAIDLLKAKENEFQEAVDNMKKTREELEKSLAKT